MTGDKTAAATAARRNKLGDRMVSTSSRKMRKRACRVEFLAVLKEAATDARLGAATRKTPCPVSKRISPRVSNIGDSAIALAAGIPDVNAP
jgi:hypothetical protein